MKLIKLIYILIFFIVVIILVPITMIIALSPSRPVRIYPPGLLHELKNHEILDFMRTKAYNGRAGEFHIYFNLYLRNVDFTEDDLIAIRDTMKIYLQSDSFVDFTEILDTGMIYDDYFDISIYIMKRNGERVILFERSSINRLGEDDILRSMEEGAVYSFTNGESYIDGDYVWTTRFRGYWR